MKRFIYHLEEDPEDREHVDDQCREMAQDGSRSSALTPRRPLSNERDLEQTAAYVVHLMNDYLDKGYAV